MPPPYDALVLIAPLLAKDDARALASASRCSRQAVAIGCSVAWIDCSSADANAVRAEYDRLRREPKRTRVVINAGKLDSVDDLFRVATNLRRIDRLPSEGGLVWAVSSDRQLNNRPADLLEDQHCGGQPPAANRLGYVMAEFGIRKVAMVYRPLLVLPTWALPAVRHGRALKDAFPLRRGAYSVDDPITGPIRVTETVDWACKEVLYRQIVYCT